MSENVVSSNAATPAEQAVRFWTPDRVKLAADYDTALDARSNGVKGGDSTPDGPPGSVPPIGEETTKTVKSKQVNLPNTVGRVFFTLPGSNPAIPASWRYCSATSVQGKYRNLVATSAHCVYDTKKDTFYDNWIFIPSYWDGDNAWEGKAPYGIYAAKTFNAHDDFVVKEDSWNRSAKANVSSFGYPAGEHPDGDKPFTGRTMKWCYGRTAPMPAAPKYNLQEHVGLKCALTAGAGGGPFLFSYKSSTRTGYLIGVNSVAWDTDGNDRYDHVSSPYFNTDTYKVYKTAANRWTGNMP